VDILDAGPIIEAPKTAFKTAIESRHLTVGKIIPTLTSAASEEHIMMISNTQMDFKVTLGYVLVTDNGEACIEEKVAECVDLRVGESLRFSIFH
jgi:arginine/ornithine N-succinyltransferase beta subunit